MKNFLVQLVKNLKNCFYGKILLWHVLACVLTAALVLSGFDYWWFTATRSDSALVFLFPAVVIGGLLPIVTPFVLLVFAFVSKNKKLAHSVLAVVQAEFLGFFISGFYKSLTGRIGPPQSMAAHLTDMTHIFRFGFWRGGVFWGWPSTHTTVAFAMAMAIFTLYPKNYAARILCVVYALYIGIGVSVSIHWFSDFVAGAIFGTLIGVTVGRSFVFASRGVIQSVAKDPFSLTTRK